jgi:phage-related protein (TIGR01555 family)
MGLMAGFVDTLTNLVTGLGTAKDKALGASYAFTPLTVDQLAYAYRGDWIARKVVDIPAFDMVRAGRFWHAEDDQIEALEEGERRLALKPKLAKALKMARLCGGSAMILGVRQGQPSEEMVVDRVGKGALQYIHVVNRYELTCGEIDRDPMSPRYGEPKTYELNGAQMGSVQIHPSRVIRFTGPAIPDLMGGSFDGWGDSVLDAVNDAVISAGLTTQGIAHLVQEAKVDVFKIKGLTEKVGKEDYRTRMLERFRLANVAKSLQQALIMDAEEEYEQKTINFAQLPDIARLYLSIAAGAADIPATRFLSQSPGGMNATGDSDVRNYYDRLSAEQELDLRPQLERLDEVLIRSELGTRPPEIYFTFAPLWQMSEKERAEIFNTKATAARTIAGTGGASPALMPIEALSDALVNAFIEDGSLPGLEAAIDEYGKLSEQEEDEAEQEAALPPQPLAVAANDAAGAIIAWATRRGFSDADPLDRQKTLRRILAWLEVERAA